MNLQPINPYQLIKYLNEQIKSLAEANSEIMGSILSAEITDVSKNGVIMTATIDLDENTKQEVEVTIKTSKGKGNKALFETIAERLIFLKEFTIATMENLKNDSMD